MGSTGSAFHGNASKAYIRAVIASRLEDLPALPNAVIKVIQETGKPDPSAKKVENYIGSDQSLASKLLRVVNSAYYGLSGQVSSVSQAVVILGMQQVRNLALGVGAVATFDSRSQSQQNMLRMFWLHGFSSAHATQLVARSLRIDTRSAETLFVGGLLHDIGRLFLFWHLPDMYQQVLDTAIKEERPIEEVEREILGTDHAEVGYQMAEKWKLPEQLCEMIRDHEGPFQDGEARPLTFGVHAADSLAKFLYYPSDAVVVSGLDPHVESWICSGTITFEEMSTSVHDQIGVANQMYGLLAA